MTFGANQHHVALAAAAALLALAVGVVIAIGATAALAGVGVAAWWVMPVAVVGLLGISLRGNP